MWMGHNPTMTSNNPNDFETCIAAPGCPPIGLSLTEPRAGVTLEAAQGKVPSCVAPSQSKSEAREGALFLPLLTVGDVSTLLRISLKSTYRLVERRSVPYYRVGGVLRFKREDVERYLEARLVRAVNDLDV